MKMYSVAKNTMSEIEAFINERGIPKENIINIFHANGNYFLNYYAE